MEPTSVGPVSATQDAPLPDSYTMELLTKNFSRRSEDKLSKDEIAHLKQVRASVAPEVWKSYEHAGRAAEKKRRHALQHQATANNAATASSDASMNPLPAQPVAAPSATSQSLVDVSAIQSPQRTVPLASSNALFVSPAAPLGVSSRFASSGVEVLGRSGAPAMPALPNPPTAPLFPTDIQCGALFVCVGQSVADAAAAASPAHAGLLRPFAWQPRYVTMSRGGLGHGLGPGGSAAAQPDGDRRELCIWEDYTAYAGAHAAYASGTGYGIPGSSGTDRSAPQTQPPVPLLTIDLTSVSVIMGAGQGHGGGSSGTATLGSSGAGQAGHAPTDYAFRLIQLPKASASGGGAGGAAAVVGGLIQPEDERPLAWFAADSWSALNSWYGTLSKWCFHQARPDGTIVRGQAVPMSPPYKQPSFRVAQGTATAQPEAASVQASPRLLAGSGVGISSQAVRPMEALPSSPGQATMNVTVHMVAVPAGSAGAGAAASQPGPSTPPQHGGAYSYGTGSAGNVPGHEQYEEAAEVPLVVSPEPEGYPIPEGYPSGGGAGAATGAAGLAAAGYEEEAEEEYSSAGRPVFTAMSAAVPVPQPSFPSAGGSGNGSGSGFPSASASAVGGYPTASSGYPTAAGNVNDSNSGRPTFARRLEPGQAIGRVSDVDTGVQTGPGSFGPATGAAGAAAPSFSTGLQPRQPPLPPSGPRVVVVGQAGPSSSSVSTAQAWQQGTGPVRVGGIASSSLSSRDQAQHQHQSSSSSSQHQQSSQPQPQPKDIPVVATSSHWVGGLRTGTAEPVTAAGHRRGSSSGHYGTDGRATGGVTIPQVSSRLLVPTATWAQHERTRVEDEEYRAREKARLAAEEARAQAALMNRQPLQGPGSSSGSADGDGQGHYGVNGQEHRHATRATGAGSRRAASSHGTRAQPRRPPASAILAATAPGRTGEASGMRQYAAAQSQAHSQQHRTDGRAHHRNGGSSAASLGGSSGYRAASHGPSLLDRTTEIGLRAVEARVRSPGQVYVPNRMDHAHRAQNIPAPSSSLHSFTYSTGYEKPGWHARALGGPGTVGGLPHAQLVDGVPQGLVDRSFAGAPSLMAGSTFGGPQQSLSVTGYTGLAGSGEAGTTSSGGPAVVFEPASVRGAGAPPALGLTSPHSTLPGQAPPEAFSMAIPTVHSMHHGHGHHNTTAAGFNGTASATGSVVGHRAPGEVVGREPPASVAVPVLTSLTQPKRMGSPRHRRPWAGVGTGHDTGNTTVGSGHNNTGHGLGSTNGHIHNLTSASGTTGQQQQPIRVATRALSPGVQRRVMWSGQAWPVVQATMLGQGMTSGAGGVGSSAGSVSGSATGANVLPPELAYEGQHDGGWDGAGQAYTSSGHGQVQGHPQAAHHADTEAEGDGSLSPHDEQRLSTMLLDHIATVEAALRSAEADKARLAAQLSQVTTGAAGGSGAGQEKMSGKAQPQARGRGQTARAGQPQSSPPRVTYAVTSSKPSATGPVSAGPTVAASAVSSVGISVVTTPTAAVAASEAESESSVVRTATESPEVLRSRLASLRAVARSVGEGLGLGSSSGHGLGYGYGYSTDAAGAGGAGAGALLGLSVLDSTLRTATAATGATATGAVNIGGGSSSRRGSAGSLSVAAPVPPGGQGQGAVRPPSVPISGNTTTIGAGVPSLSSLSSQLTALQTSMSDLSSRLAQDKAAAQMTGPGQVLAAVQMGGQAYGQPQQQQYGQAGQVPARGHGQAGHYNTTSSANTSHNLTVSSADTSGLGGAGGHGSVTGGGQLAGGYGEPVFGRGFGAGFAQGPPTQAGPMTLESISGSPARNLASARDISSTGLGYGQALAHGHGSAPRRDVTTYALILPGPAVSAAVEGSGSPRPVLSPVVAHTSNSVLCVASGLPALARAVAIHAEPGGQPGRETVLLRFHHVFAQGQVLQGQGQAESNGSALATALQQPLFSAREAVTSLRLGPLLTDAEPRGQVCFMLVGTQPELRPLSDVALGHVLPGTNVHQPGLLPLLLSQAFAAGADRLGTTPGDGAVTATLHAVLVGPASGQMYDVLLPVGKRLGKAPPRISVPAHGQGSNGTANGAHNNNSSNGGHNTSALSLSSSRLFAGPGAQDRVWLSGSMGVRVGTEGEASRIATVLAARLLDVTAPSNTELADAGWSAADRVGAALVLQVDVTCLGVPAGRLVLSMLPTPAPAAQGLVRPALARACFLSPDRTRDPVPLTPMEQLLLPPSSGSSGVAATGTASVMMMVSHGQE